MPLLKNLVSETFAALTVLSREPNNEKGRAEWLCLCLCGSTCIKSSRNLLSGCARSCGCLMRIDDMIGRTYGRLIVLGLSEFAEGGRTVCSCKCDCGSFFDAPASALRIGHTRSCGCLKRERCALMGEQKRIDRAGVVYGSSRAIRPVVKEGAGPLHWECLCVCGRTFHVLAGNLRNGAGPTCGCKAHPDLSNMVYGLLTVLRPDGNRNGQNLWLCRCACGTEKSIRTTSLKRGLTISCGCLIGGHSLVQRSVVIRTTARCASQVHRAQRAFTGGTFTTEDVKHRFKWQRGRCAMPWCRVRLTDDNMTVDHITPISPRRRGGVQTPNLNDRRNTQLLCRPCNLKKSDKDPLIHARDNGFLL